MKKILLLVLAFMSMSAVMARPVYMEYYNVHPKALEERKNRCELCHVSAEGGSGINKFGIMFLKAKREITTEMVAKFPHYFTK